MGALTMCPLICVVSCVCECVLGCLLLYVCFHACGFRILLLHACSYSIHVLFHIHFGCGQKPWYGSFRAAVRVIQTLWIRALIQALWIKPTSHLIQAPNMNTSAWWHFTPPLSHQFTVKVVASQIKATLFAASLF